MDLLSVKLWALLKKSYLCKTDFIIISVLEIKSISGVKIRLTDERWVHIVERHPEMAGHMYEVLTAMADPDLVVKGNKDELFALAYRNPAKLLVVVYKETETDGYILTSYFSSKIEKHLNRQIIWKK